MIALPRCILGGTVVIDVSLPRWLRAFMKKPARSPVLCGEKIGAHYTRATDACELPVRWKITTGLLSDSYVCHEHLGDVLSAQATAWWSSAGRLYQPRVLFLTHEGVPE